MRPVRPLAEEAHLNYSVIEKGDDETFAPESHTSTAQITSTFPLVGESVGGQPAFLALTARICMSKMPTCFTSRCCSCKFHYHFGYAARRKTMRTASERGGGFAHNRLFEIDNLLQKVLGF